MNMRSYPEFKAQNQIKNIFDDKRIQRFYLDIFDKVYRNKVDAWDYPWSYAIWRQNGLCIVPNNNLVSNIGFGSEGTYCTNKNDIKANMQTIAMGKLIHPEFVLANKKADTVAFEKLFYPSCAKKIKFLVRLMQGRESFAKLIALMGR